MVVAGAIIGFGLGLYYRADPMSSVIEGVFGAASALGIYQVSSRTPGVRKVLGDKGWLENV